MYVLRSNRDERNRAKLMDNDGWSIFEDDQLAEVSDVYLPVDESRGSVYTAGIDRDETASLLIEFCKFDTAFALKTIVDIIEMLQTKRK